LDLYSETISERSRLRISNNSMDSMQTGFTGFQSKNRRGGDFLKADHWIIAKSAQIYHTFTRNNYRHFKYAR